MSPQYRIKSPCTADWNSMPGDDLVRYCSKCQLHVHNLLAMQPAEVEKLFANSKGRVCGRLVQPAAVPTENSAGNLRTATGVLAALVTIAGANANAAPGQGKVPSKPQSAKQAFAITIEDQTGAVFAHVLVKLRRQTDSKEFETQTDDTGQVQLSRIPSGVYEISVSSPGFLPTNQREVSVPLVRPLSLKLSVMALVGEISLVGPPVESVSVPAPDTLQAVPVMEPLMAPQTPKTKPAPEQSRPIHDANSANALGENLEGPVKLELANDEDSQPPRIFATSPTQVTVTAEPVAIMGSVVRIGTNPFRRFFTVVKRLF
jgi:Carboxypeptidase regulatory-like domain